MHARALILSLAVALPVATAADEPKFPIEVQVCKPIAKEVTDFLEMGAHAEAAERVEIRARVLGQVAKVLFKEGSQVKKGDALFELDDRIQQKELEKAKAGRIKAEASAKSAIDNLARVEEAFKKGVAGQQEFDRAKAEFDVARATVAASRAHVEFAELNLSFTRIAAPINGRIGRCLVDPGNLAKADDTLLATIVSVDPIHIYFDIDERTALRLRRQANDGLLKPEGIPVGVALSDEAGYPRQGKLDFVNNMIDPATATLRCRAVLPNPKGLFLPGMFVRVRLPLGGPYKALMVPESAIFSTSDAKVVYVVNAQNFLELRTVELGQVAGQLRAIRDGLKETDRVVVKGVNRLGVGDAVDPKLVEISGLEKPKKPATQEK
jgi:RND family efflux transporter MFP subunit